MPRVIWLEGCGAGVFAVGVPFSRVGEDVDDFGHVLSLPASEVLETPLR